MFCEKELVPPWLAMDVKQKEYLIYDMISKTCWKKGQRAYKEYFPTYEKVQINS